MQRVGCSLKKMFTSRLELNMFGFFFNFFFFPPVDQLLFCCFFLSLFSSTFFTFFTNFNMRTAALALGATLLTAVSGKSYHNDSRLQLLKLTRLLYCYFYSLLSVQLTHMPLDINPIVSSCCFVCSILSANSFFRFRTPQETNTNNFT